MDFLKIKTFLTKAGIRITIFIAGLTVGSFSNYLFPNIAPKINTSIQSVTLQDVKVAWVHESSEAILLDREKNTVLSILDSNLTTIIYSYKSSAIQKDIENSRKTVLSKR